MYSKMLYMKTRVTFRLPNDLAQALKYLPNQTSFVETALRDALGRSCPTCGGTGRVPAGRLQVSNVKQAGLSRLSRDEALYLKQLIRLANDLAATELQLSKSLPGEHALGFQLTRNESVLLSGTLDEQGTRFRAN